MAKTFSSYSGHTRVGSSSDGIVCHDCGATGVCSGETLDWFLDGQQIFRCPIQIRVADRPVNASYLAWLHARLRDPYLAIGYLQAHLEPDDGVVDKFFLALALRDIAEAHGADDVLRKSLEK